MATTTVYFAARNGKVVTRGWDRPRREVQMYVNRNNVNSARHGDTSDPYHMLAYEIPADAQPVSPLRQYEEELAAALAKMDMEPSAMSYQEQAEYLLRELGA